MKKALVSLSLLLLARLLFYFFYIENDVNIHMLFRFDERALAVMQGEGFKDFAAWGTYPLFLGLIYKCIHFLQLLDYRISILFWINQGLSLWAVLLLFKSVDPMWAKNKLKQSLFWILFGLNPFFVYLSAMNMSESLFLFFVTIFFVHFHQVQKSERLRNAFIAGAALGISLALRNIISLFVVLFFAMLIYRVIKRKETWKTSLSMMLLVSLVPVILGQLNSLYDLKGQKGTSLNRGPNLAQTWCEAQTIQTENTAGSFWFRPPEYRFGNETEGLYVDQPFQNTKYFTELAVYCLQESPILLLVRLRSILNSFDGVLYPDPLKLATLQIGKFFKWFHLLIFALFLFSVITLLKKEESRIYALFVLGCLGSVYIGNVGEMRFFYSFYPAMAVLIGYSLQNQSIQETSFRLFGAAALATVLIGTPSLTSIQNHLRSHQFNSLSKDEILQKIERHMRFLNSKEVICQREADFKTSLTGHSDPAKAVRHFLTQAYERQLTEMQFFCRNHLLVQVRNEGLFSATINDIGYVTPLPGGLTQHHPLVAIAGQLLHNDLLIGNSGADLILESEKYYDLFRTLFKYQHRLSLNRANMIGKVVEYPRSAQPNAVSEKILELVFNDFLESLNYFESNNIRFDYLKLK